MLYAPSEPRCRNPQPAYHGEFYDFEGFVVDPCAIQERVPLWVGGRSLRSLRRAAALADGWCPFAVTPAQAAEWLASEWISLAGFEVVLPPTARLEPIDEPSQAQDILAATEAHGATIVHCAFTHRSLEEYLEKLHALSELHSGLRSP